MTENQGTGQPKAKRGRAGRLVTVLTYALLVGAAVASFVIPETLPVVESADQSIDRHMLRDTPEPNASAKPPLHHVSAPTR